MSKTDFLTIREEGRNLKDEKEWEDGDGIVTKVTLVLPMRTRFEYNWRIKVQNGIVRPRKLWKIFFNKDTGREDVETGKNQGTESDWKEGPIRRNCNQMIWRYKPAEEYGLVGVD